MLNKEICIKCKEKLYAACYSNLPNTRAVALENFIIEFDKGEFPCHEEWNRLLRTSEEPPKACPYQLEHIMQREIENVE